MAASPRSFAALMKSSDLVPFSPAIFIPLFFVHHDQSPRQSLLNKSPSFGLVPIDDDLFWLISDREYDLNSIKKAPRGRGVRAFRLNSLGVGNAAVGQRRLSAGDGSFGLHVALAAVGQGHWRFLEASSGPRSMA